MGKKQKILLGNYFSDKRKLVWNLAYLLCSYWQNIPHTVTETLQTNKCQFWSIYSTKPAFYNCYNKDMEWQKIANLTRMFMRC